MNVFRTVAIVLIALCSKQSFATEERYPEDIGDQLASYIEKSGFSGASLITVGDTVVVHEAFGNANWQFSVPNTTGTRFRIASVTKLFTVVMVMQLLEEGKIDLAGTIGSYLPDYDGEGADIVTVYHLLTATSGLDSFEAKGEEVYESRYTSDEILELYCSGPMYSEPGIGFFYNNADFFILGKIVEQLRGTSYADALKEYLLTPLNMSDTGVITSDRIIDKLAYAYDDVGDPPVFINDPLFYIETTVARAQCIRRCTI